VSIIDEIINSSSTSKIKRGKQTNWLEQFFNELDSSSNQIDVEKTQKIENFEIEEKDSSFDKFWAEILASEESSTSTENKINESRIRKIDEQLTQDFIYLLREEDFEFGYKTRSEEIISEQLNINALATRNWLNKIFLNYYSDEIVIIGILRIIGRFDPIQIFPQGQTIALAALTHKNDEIKELGIRAFEQWCSIESLNILRKLDIEKAWLKDYVNDVIKDFEEQLCHI
jgi:hypothetical protein